MVSLIYIALSGLLLTFLTYRAAMERRRSSTGLGHAGNPVLERKVRAQGNAAEQLPLMMLLLLGLELSGAVPLALHALGSAFLAGRGLHAWGLTHKSGQSPGRLYGMLLTVGCYLAGAGLAFHLIILAS